MGLKLLKKIIIAQVKCNRPFTLIQLSIWNLENTVKPALVTTSIKLQSNLL
jgi:hypothetical protein